MGLCAVFRWCEGCRNKTSAVKIGSRPNFRKDALVFQTLSRPEAIRGQPSKYEDLPYISIGYGGESASQSPLKDKGFSTFRGQNPPFELPPENGISPSTKACLAQWPVIDNSAITRLAKGKLRRTAQPGAWAFALRRQRSHVRIVSGPPVSSCFPTRCARSDRNCSSVSFARVSANETVAHQLTQAAPNLALASGRRP